MAKLDIEEMKKAIDDFFANATDEDIEQMLKDTGYEFYKNVKSPPLTTIAWRCNVCDCHLDHDEVATHLKKVHLVGIDTPRKHTYIGHIDRKECLKESFNWEVGGISLTQELTTYRNPDDHFGKY